MLCDMISNQKQKTNRLARVRRWHRRSRALPCQLKTGPTHQPKATEHIDLMIEMVDILIKNNPLKLELDITVEVLADINRLNNVFVVVN